jgi:hypothetical protein
MTPIVIPIFKNPVILALLYEEYITKEELKILLSLDKESLELDLLNLINFCLQNKEYVIEDESCSLEVIVYALFILKEISSNNYLDLILEIAKLDEETLDIWFSDFYTEYYWSLIVHFGSNDIEKLIDYLKSIKIDTFFNEQVAMALLQIFFRDEEKHEIIRAYWTELLEYYKNLSEDEIDPTYLAFFVSYVHRPNDYQLSLIKSLYEKDFIDESVNGSFEELFEIEEEYRELATIFDIQIVLEKYYNEVNDPFIYDEYIDELYKNDNQQTTIVNKEPKINRNDNCPCGSGKKYKKCCINE